MAVEFKDYYATLGVPRDASEEDIKRSFRKLARQHHPDVAKDKKTAEEKFKEINEAYEVLGDPRKRKKYDELGANWKEGSDIKRSGFPSSRIAVVCQTALIGTSRCPAATNAHSVGFLRFFLRSRSGSWFNSTHPRRKKNGQKSRFQTYEYKASPDESWMDYCRCSDS